MATRASGCQRWAIASRVRARRRSPPMASKPVAPTHQVPFTAPAGETCGLAWISAAVARVRAPVIAISSHGSTCSRVQRAFASVTVMPARTRALPAAAVTARSVLPSARARRRASQCCPVSAGVVTAGWVVSSPSPSPSCRGP